MRKRLVLGIIMGLLPLAGCFKNGPAITQPAISISIPNFTNTVAPGKSVTISANVYDQRGQGVTWSMAPLNFGTLSNPTFDSGTLTASVTYTVPASLAIPTNVTITATSITNPNVATSVAVHCSPVVVAILEFTSGPTLPMAPATVSPANFVLMQSAVGVNGISDNSAVTWTLSPQGVGTSTVSGPNGQYFYYTAPPSISAPTTLTVTATSVEDPSISAQAQITVMPGGGPNVALLNVNGGPVPGQVYPNRAYTSVTICNPGSSSASIPTCQTVDGVLVDTGSYGLRILESQIPALKLPGLSDPNGNVLENCASRPDGLVLWGPVRQAEVYIAGESATSSGSVFALPIQVIPSAPSAVPQGCSSTGVSNSNTPELLGANGILGIGPEPTDCTLSSVNYCDGSNPPTPPPNLYYSCPSSGCSATDSPVTAAAGMQVSNPVAFFAAYNGALPDSNGLIIQLPAVSNPQASASGTLTFGIATQANNNLVGATVLTLDANDYFTTAFAGQTLTHGTIDSSTNALLFPDALPMCTSHQGLYCPAAPVTLSATNIGKSGGQSSVNFTAENADSLFFTFGQDLVFPTLTGASQNGSCPSGTAACVFKWGLPFFYGRKVYEAIDSPGNKQSVFGAPAAPWWAY